MKKVIVGMLVIIGFAACNYVEHNYTIKDCEVIYKDSNYITIADNNGNSWDAKSNSNRFQVGDIVDIRLNDNCTYSTNEDDKVLSVVKR